AGAIQVPQLPGAQARHEFYGRTRGRAEAVLLRAAPDHDEPAAEPARRFDRRVEPLVRDERADAQKEVLPRRSVAVAVVVAVVEPDVDRGMHDGGVPIVEAADPVRDGGRVGEVARGAGGGPTVPVAEAREDPDLEPAQGVARRNVEVELVV